MKNGRRVKNPKRNSSIRSKSKVLDISIIILIIALALVIAVGTIRDKKTLAKNMEIYSSDSSNNSEDNEKQATTSNPYEKIKKGEEVNILVLGNGVGLSEGKTDESGNWTSSLSKWLEETYKSKANITNLSQDKATVKVGLEELEKNKDSFDLAYIIFGENDQKEIKPNEFKEDYEKIIKNLKERNKNISIVPIIENSLRNKNEYTNIIQNIGKDNDIKVLDMATVFIKDPAPYAKLTTKSRIYPNNVGYSLYFSNIKSLIEANIEALN
ncbi:SGNH/GDSL hydrolase family protein [Clostridium perfringens]|uniref:SGNH/GDSL hydrolase family protein n=1 Tax=Clostridium perfringens TaxID=1502 RepID=UPI002904A5A5|nr:SGNH/GDSL hydrolase family protein [Clostridium perfringens]MDM0745695.1 SGNH/GDSL hydrolase family protein [Clostridium perfringens]MDU2169190.1 SGNH/GDSL hydrolase family protein [Clostridium perfringens]MDU4132405.1 SGNH/GDSL hydrolase family protein [Clostridium perfringens]